MIWGAIFGGDCTDLFEINRDPNSKRNGYSRWSYLEALRTNLPQVMIENRIFMHDNAPIHIAYDVQNWLCDNDINTMDWPPYSPDLNPIKHTWAKLKEMIDRLDLTLEQFDGTESELINHFEELIHASWSMLGQDYFDRLIESMPRHVAAVIEAEGWYTKY